MSIKIGNYTFEGPFSSTSSLEDRSGVYAILDDDNRKIDIGESHEVRTRVENHERKSCWEENNYSKYAAYYTSEANRKRIESELRDQYNPPCGER